ncbi:hypothetical protein [Agromyces humi]|uniref:hypothetical protein n=1 Tax=Agromyces humi TaxID=1766800 RepID=UPI0013572F5A|nr:hypothetical protein [Agromyces humi]
MTITAPVTHIRTNRAPLTRSQLLSMVVDRFEATGEPVEFHSSSAGDERRIIGSLFADGLVDFAGVGNGVIPTAAGRELAHAQAA